MKTSVGYIYWHVEKQCLTWTGRGASSAALPMHYSVFVDNSERCTTREQAKELVAALEQAYSKVTFLGAYDNEHKMREHLNTLPEWTAARR